MSLFVILHLKTVFIAGMQWSTASSGRIVQITVDKLSVYSA